ncbi:MAG: uridylate kinase [Eubacteriales bacterium]|nr:uridylate kinase [Eubacteriales bacterium]
MNKIEIVGKIGSMAMIRTDKRAIDYNVISQVAEALRPGMIWVTSGAAEIGRLDYMQRTGRELSGDKEEIKADYCAQGQTILMNNYRQFARPEYSLRQVLLEHQHFNNPVKREAIKRLMLRAAEQNAVPIVNYNDTVSDEEIRKMELFALREKQEDIVECVDNDETAAVLCELVQARYLVILSSTEGIYFDAQDPSTLVREVICPDADTLVKRIDALKEKCVGASRAGANGARAKLEFAMKPALHGATVIIGHARYPIADLIGGGAPQTRIGIARD